MWQEISNNSGLPSSLLSPSGVDDELYSSIPNAVASLQLDFQLESERLSRDVNDASQAEIQQQLIHITNHAAAIEIDASNERERNRALGQTVRCLEEDNMNLQNNVSELTIALQERDKHIKDLELALTRSKESEIELRSSISGLQSDLETQKVTEEKLRAEHGKKLQELDEVKSQVSIYKERVSHAQDNLRDAIQASKEREAKAISMAQAEANHAIEVAEAKANQDMAQLEAKLHNTQEQLEKAETRETQATTAAEGTRQEIKELHQQLNKAQMESKEKANHCRTEMKQLQTKLEALQQTNVCLKEQALASNNQLKEAELIIKGKDHELECVSTQYGQLQTELEQSKKAKELLSEDVASLNTKVSLLQKNKDDCEETIQLLKEKLEDERHRYARAMNSLEGSIIASVRDQFSSTNISSPNNL